MDSPVQNRAPGQALLDERPTVHVGHSVTLLVAVLVSSINKSVNDESNKVEAIRLGGTTTFSKRRSWIFVVRIHLVLPHLTPPPPIALFVERIKG